MTKFIQYLGFLCFLFVSSSISASSIENFNQEVWQDTYACEESYAVLFGNGIWTNQKKAFKAIQKLETLISADPNFQALDKPVMFNNAYNSTMVVFADLFEATSQKVQADVKQLFRWMGDLDTMPTEARKKLINIADTVENHQISRLGTTIGHSKLYNSLLNNGRQIVPVTHSQGNLFINEAYWGIHDSLLDGVGIVSVGNPDDLVADNDKNHEFENITGFTGTAPIYNINLKEDWFMRAVGLNRWNFDNYPDAIFGARDVLGHSFRKAYLDTNANPSRTAADAIVDATYERFKKTKSAKCRTPMLTVPKGPDAGNSRIIDNGSTLAIAPTTQAIHTTNTRMVSLLDWKGAYENNIATKSISFHGPTARISGFHGYANKIYRDGRPFYVFSLLDDQRYVLGAALTEDDKGDEWVIAVTTNENNTNAVYKRKVKKVQGLTVVDNNPSKVPNRLKPNEPYWQKIGEFTFDNKSKRYAPWHFNGDGTEAQTLRREKVTLAFGDGDCPYNQICHYTRFENHEVEVLNRYKLVISSDLSSARLQNMGFETGDTGLLAVDYLDDKELILRERNFRTHAADPLSVPASESVWLELNGEPVMDSRILTCTHKSFYACLPAVDTLFSSAWNGLTGHFQGLVDGSSTVRETILHMHFMDLRTRTFEYSKYTMDFPEYGTSPAKAFISSDAEYYYSHKDGDPVLMTSIKFTDAEFQSLGNALGASFYGRAGNFHNRSILNRMTPPIRGQYLASYSPVVAPEPVYSGRVIEPDGHLLISTRFKNGETYNYYSRQNLEQLIGVDLTGETVLPVALN